MNRLEIILWIIGATAFEVVTIIFAHHPNTFTRELIFWGVLVLVNLILYVSCKNCFPTGAPVNWKYVEKGKVYFASAVTTGGTKTIVTVALSNSQNGRDAARSCVFDVRIKAEDLQGKQFVIIDDPLQYTAEWQKNGVVSLVTDDLIEQRGASYKITQPA